MNINNFAAMAGAVVALESQTITTTTNGPAVDCRQYDGEAAIVLNASAMSTGDTMDVKVQESADGSTDWQDITGATFTQVTDAAASLQMIGVDLRKSRGYIRLVFTLAGATISVVVGAAAVMPQKYAA